MQVRVLLTVIVLSLMSVGCDSGPKPRDPMAGVSDADKDVCRKALDDAGKKNKIIAIADRGDYWDVSIEPGGPGAGRAEMSVLPTRVSKSLKKVITQDAGGGGNAPKVTNS